VRFFEHRDVLVFAHRGGCALGPENTVAAFDAGLATGADGLELDVHLSADGVPVVHHDSTLERTTNGRGPIADRTADELARLDAAQHFERGGSFPLRGAGVGVPTLLDVLKRYPSARIIIEMKVDSAGLGERVALDVRSADAVDRVCLAGSGTRSAAAARRALPDAATSATRAEARLALYRSWLGWPVDRPPHGGYQVPERASGHRIVSPRFIRHAHAAGLRVQVWTVDDRRDMDRLLHWGVDALISNRPDAAVQVRDSRPSRSPSAVAAGRGDEAR